MAKTLKMKGGEVTSVKKLKASLKKSQGGNTYLTRVPANGSITGRFLTEPEPSNGLPGWREVWLHYDETREPRNFPCTDPCEYEENGGDKARKCYLANFLDTDDGKVVLLQMPQTLANSVLKKYEKFKTLLDRDYELTREGTTMNDTEYDATPESPRRMKLDRYNLIDIEEVLLNMLDTEDDDDDDDDEEDEKPKKKSSKGGKPIAKKKKRKIVDEDEEEDDDDDEDEEEEVRPRRLKKTPPPKGKTIKKKIKRK